MSLLVAKGVGALSVFFCNATASFFTYGYLLSKCQLRTLPKRLKATLSAASCFSIGLFMGICFLGLYHSAAVKMKEMQDRLPHTEWIKLYPISETLLCLGFFILWISEGIIRIIISRAMENSPSSKRTSYNPVKLLSMTKLRPDLSIERPDDEVNLLETHETHRLSEITPNGMDNDAQSASSFLKSLMLTSAMGLHTFLESLGFGLLDSLNEVVSMGLAMVLHQTLCAATLGLRLARASDSRRKGCYTLLLLIFYVFLVPLGTGIGLRLHYTQQSSFNSSVCADSVSICTSSNSTTGIGQPRQMYTTVLMSVLQNFASSAFLYVVFMEMLPAELSRDSASETSCHMTCNDVVSVDANHTFRNHSLVSCFCAFLGFGFLALLRIFHHRDHS